VNESLFNIRTKVCFCPRCNTSETPAVGLKSKISFLSIVDHVCEIRLSNISNSSRIVYFRDVMCGLLHCDHASEKLMFWKEALTLTLPETWVHTKDGQRHECKAAILDVGLDMVDPGMVQDGTECGHQRVCSSRPSSSSSSSR